MDGLNFAFVAVREPLKGIVQRREPVWLVQLLARRRLPVPRQLPVSAFQKAGHSSSLG
jgi:hypothetical protein